MLGAPFLLHTLLTGILYMLMWPAAVHLALVFPAPAPVLDRRPWLIPAIYAVALGAYAVALGVVAGRQPVAPRLDRDLAAGRSSPSSSRAS